MNDTVVNVVSGLAAGITGTVLGHPLDTVKTMMQSGGGDSAVSTLRRLAKEGRMVSSLYAGVTPPLVSSVLLNAVCFAAYSHQEQAIRGFFSSSAPASLATEGSGRCEAQDDPGSGDLRVVASSAWEPAIPWIAGSSVGFISSFISTPFEVVKRQLSEEGRELFAKVGSRPVPIPPRARMRCARNVQQHIDSSWLRRWIGHA